MCSISRFLVAAMVLAPISTATQAADMDAPIPHVEAVASDSGLYLRGDIGAALLRWNGGDDDEAWSIGGGIGYQASDFFRTDLTLDWNGDYSIGGGQNVSSLAVMGNAYLDWANDSLFTPYLGAGVGYNWVDNNANGMVLGVAAGVAVNINENLVIDTGYKFRDTMASGPDLKEHMLTAGMRFKF